MTRQHRCPVPSWSLLAIALLAPPSVRADDGYPDIGDRLPRVPQPALRQGSPTVSERILGAPGYLVAPSSRVQVEVLAPATTAYPGVLLETTAPMAVEARSQPPRKPAGPLFTDKSPPFAGSDLFVGRSVKVPARKTRVEVGVVGQVVPLDVVLGTNRNTLISRGVSAACADSTDPNCRRDAVSVADRTLDVLGRLSGSQWARVLAAARNPQAMEPTLRSIGITDAEEISAVQEYLDTIPSQKRTQAILLARRLAEQTATVRIEPFTNVNLKSLQVRVGVPMSLGVRGADTSFDLGNVNFDVSTGWEKRIPHASLGLSVGITTYLPTSTGSEDVSLMADLFQASKYLYGYLTFAPYVVAGIDARWVSLQVHADLWIQARVRTLAAASNAQVLQYGTGLTLLPHFPISLVGQVEGLEGLNNARAFRSLFVVAGLQLNLWHARLGLAAQIPIVDRAREALGTYGGRDVGGLAKYTILARTSVSF